MLELWERSRFTMVFVTHDLDEATVLSDRIAVLRGHPGRLAQVIDVNLPRPRARSSVQLQQIKREITQVLDLS